MPAWVAFWHWKDHYSYYFVFLFLMIFFIVSQQAIFSYWVTSNLFTIAQVGLLKSSAVRRAVGIPEMIKHENLPEAGSWLENLKAGELSWPIQSTYNEFPSPFPFIKTLHLFSSLFSILSIFLPFNIFVISPLNHFLFIPVLYTDLPYAYLPIKQLLYLLLSLSAYSSNLST